MKYKNLFVSFLIILLLTVHVMPFNIIHADEQTPNFGKIFLEDSSIPYRYGDYGPVDFSITGSAYIYGYYEYDYTTNLRVLSTSNFTSNPSGGGNPYLHEINGNTFYMSRGTTRQVNYSPYVTINGFPQYTQNNNDIPNDGDYVYDLLGSNSFVLPTKYDANQSFYSWTSGSNPYTITCSSDVYVVGFAMGNLNSNWSSFHVYFFTDEDATLEITRANGSITPTHGSTTYKGIDINYYLVSSWSYNPAGYTYTWNTNLMKTSGYQPNALHIAYNIYLNEIYEEPVPPVQYGDVVANFYTKYAGSGLTDDSQTWRENLDVIQWSNYDSLGQFINDYGLIEIRAVPGYFVGLSQVSLLNQIYTDFVLDNELVSESYLLNPSDQEFTRKWGNMVNDWTTDIPFFSLTNYFRSEKWYKDGWIWQIRIVDIEDPDTPLTQWQTIYNSTSYSGNDGLNNPALNTDTYETIQEINNINNVTNNNTWYINNVPVGVDPNNNPTSDGSWIEVLIQSIANLIGTIVQSVSDIIKAIAGFGSDIIQGIFDLIGDLGINILETFTNLWNGFINLFNGIDFTDENSEFDLDLGLQEGDSPLDIIPAFVRMMNSSGLGYMLWLPLVVGIIFMVL